MGDMADNWDENGYDAWLDHVSGNCDIDTPCQYCAEERAAKKSKKRKFNNRKDGVRK